MPSPLIGLEAGRASVPPGGQARLTLTITNTGTRVEGFNLRVLGPTAPWARVEPAQLSVYPQESGSAEVVFTPPVGTTVPGGLHPFGVMVRSTLDPLSSAITEGDVRVEKVPGLEAKIIPATSAGRWRGQHAVHLTNRGNTVAHLRMTASDPDEAIGFYLSPAEVTLPPGGQATVRLSAQARRPFLRGMAVRLPFEVVGEPADRPPGVRPPGPGYGDPSRPVVSAAFNQRPILSAGLVALLVGLLVALIAIGFYLQSRPEPAEPELGDRDAPPRPVVAVPDVGPTSVRLQWAPVESADGYGVQKVDRAGNGLQDYPRLGEVIVFEPPDLRSSTEACFHVRAFRGEAKGPWSETVCATTAAPTAPPMTSAPASATPTLPPRDDLPQLLANRASSPPTIDGIANEWVEPSTPANKLIAGSTRTTGRIALMWDVDALYLLARVADGSIDAVDPNDPARAWRGDALMLELGPDNLGLAQTEPARPNDAYYMFGLAPSVESGPTVPPADPEQTTIIGVLMPNPARTSFDEPGNATGITAAARAFDGGYVLEARIPWASTGLDGPNAQLAANVVVSDRKQQPFGNLGMVSTNQQRTFDLRAHPYYWQHLQLLP